MNASDQLIHIIKEYVPVFSKITEAEWSYKPNENKWSKKEILGHLVDSAMNNLRRVIVTQYRQNDKIFYLQDDWVRLQDYQEADIHEILMLWVGLNRQFARTIKIVPKEKLKNTCDTGKDREELHNLDFLITDYISHLRHHISQITQ